jgi:type I restriction enzyme M protein
MQRIETHEQQALDFLPPLDLEGGEQHGLSETFKRIYYHLYTNSKASRAELIIEGLSLLLLSNLSAEMNGGKKVLSSYLDGKSTANKMLLPILRDAFPELLDTKQIFALGDVSLRMALSELLQLDLSRAPAHALVLFQLDRAN